MEEDFEDESDNGVEPPEDLDELPNVTPPAILPPPRQGRSRRHPPVEGLPDVTSLRAQVYALTGAQQVMFERLDQSLKLGDQSYQQLGGLMTQMNETLQLWMQSFQQVQDLADKLARIAAATVKMYQLQIEQQENSALF